MKTCQTCNGEGYADDETCYDCDGAGEMSTGNEIEVIEKETKTVTERQKQLLYDNSQDGFSNEIEFSVESTRRLILEVTIPGGGGSSTGKSKGKMMKSSDMGCVGVLVEHMTTPISGFYGTGF